MDQQIIQQLVMGGAAVALGLSGWLLPYRWNILRLKRVFAGMFSEESQRLVPKVVGTIFVMIGVVILAATAVIGRLQ